MVSPRSSADAATLIAIEASVTHEPSGREASRIQVYGIDASFFRLHGVAGVEAPTGRQALLSPGLAAELGAAANDGLLLRVQKPSAIPADTLAGRRNDTSRAVRLTTRETLAPIGWASSRCGRSRKLSAPSSCPSRDCNAISSWPGEPMCCSSPPRATRRQMPRPRNGC